jgi:antitoxin component YwqK of YwqJK toxin-antitoxin module
MKSILTALVLGVSLLLASGGGGYAQDFQKGVEAAQKGDFATAMRENGQLLKKGAFKNGEQEGPWVRYNNDGTKDEDLSGIYRDGRKVSD